MARNSNTRSNVIAGDKSAPMQTGGDEGKTRATDFANINILLASVPDQGDQGHFDIAALMDEGRTIVSALASIFEVVGDPARDVEGYRGRGMVVADMLKRSAQMHAGRVITALAGSYAYAHAFMVADQGKLAELETKVLNMDADGSREQIWGLISWRERQVAQVAGREADCYRLGCVINGALEGYEASFGEKYALPQRRAEMNQKSVNDALASVKAQIAARKAG